MEHMKNISKGYETKEDRYERVKHEDGKIVAGLCYFMDAYDEKYSTIRRIN